MTAVFVSGAGTEIGKTAVACTLLRAARRRATPADALKPVVSGFDPADPSGSDPARLLQALGRTVAGDSLAQMSPWRYRAALAPNMAARAEQQLVPYDAVVALCRARISAARSGLLLVEGAGGLMSPFSDECTNLDLAQALAVPVLLVAGSYLGAISHALTAVEVLKCRGMSMAALVVSESEGATVALQDTVAELVRFAPGAPIFPLPRVSDPEADWDVEPVLDRVLQG